MCLDFRYDPETEKAMIAKLPDEFVVYRKVYLREYDETAPYYASVIRWPIFRFKPGANKAVIDRKFIRSDKMQKYEPGFHSYKTHQGINRLHKNLGWSGYHTVKAICRREWVTAIGMQCGCRVIVSKKIIMPSPTDKKAIVN